MAAKSTAKTKKSAGSARVPVKKKTATKTVAKRSAKSSVRQFIYPNCPRCGTTMRQIDMKFNGRDDFGHLFESYHCPLRSCGYRFSITYDGPDEETAWEYDDDDY